MSIFLGICTESSVNAALGGVGMVLSRRALKLLNSKEKIQPRIMCASFHDDSCTTIISSFGSTNACDEMDITTFYDELSFLARYITKHNILIIVGDMNSKIRKDENHKFGLHNLSNRNGEYLTNLSQENSLSCLNTKFQKKKKREKKLWSYTYPSGSKA